MRKLLTIALLGGAGYAAKKFRQRNTAQTLADVDLTEPQRTTERMEAAADIPGGVRP